MAYKLSLIFTVTVTCGMVLLGLVIARDQTRLLEQQITESSTTLLKQMAEFTRDPLLTNDTLSLQIIVNNLISQDNILGAAVLSEDKHPLVSEGAIPSQTAITTMPDISRVLDWSYREQRRKIAAMTFLMPILTDDIIIGYVLITFDRSLMELARSRTINTVASATILMVILGFVISLILGKRLTRPIHRLIAASRAITAGDYKFRFEDKRKDELGALMSSMNEMTAGLLRKEQVEQIFSRYVSPKVAKEVLKNLSQVRLGGRHVNASVLFADIVGFTSISEDLSPEEVNALLNEYFSYIAQVAQYYSGHIDKYIGDCVMLVFGVPEEDSQHTAHALYCAIMIRKLVAAINERRTASGQKTVQFRIGVNSGFMLAGNMGASDRMEYTVVGDAVNLASRLSSAAGAGNILISEDVHDIVCGTSSVQCEEYGTITLKGKKEPVKAYTVLDVSGQPLQMMTTLIDDILAPHVELP
ncbi:MAG: hypothetical protein A2V90_09115 [Gammaproteobacteria bacterium RBG_16_57_12]|nr:MAG: hypothetical protein A2V90_09115 [Gammaproteobacteria bacterium RBG_16_57_12]